MYFISHERETNLIYRRIARLQENKKRLARWESIFFASNDQKLEFENMFAKNIYDSKKNQLYMSWLPLKLGAVGGNSRRRTEKHISKISSTIRLIIRTFLLNIILMIFSPIGSMQQTGKRVRGKSSIISELKYLKNRGEYMEKLFGEEGVPL